jgi:hypothetical protein
MCEVSSAEGPRPVAGAKTVVKKKKESIYEKCVPLWKWNSANLSEFHWVYLTDRTAG